MSNRSERSLDRGGLVQSLVHEPPFLFFDEPFGALDALTREQMRIDLDRASAGRRQRGGRALNGLTCVVSLWDSKTQDHLIKSCVLSPSYRFRSL
jgi:hypothetical protein